MVTLVPKRRLCYAKSAALVIILAVAMASCGREAVSPSVNAVSFDGDRAYTHVLGQVAFGPRPVGSEALRHTGSYMETYLQEQGWETWWLEAEYHGVLVRNLLARKGGEAGLPVIMLGAHYDTRPYADRDPDALLRKEPIDGANDGGSGVAVLLEFARVYDPVRSQASVVLAFFDGEDRGNIESWPFSVGSEFVAQQWASQIDAMVLVDMVGDADQQIYWERSSDPTLCRDLWDVAARLGYSEWFIAQERHALLDDHLPFVKRGVPAIDIIDFDYPYWHTTADTVDKVSPVSLERVGRVLLEYLYSGNLRHR